MTDNARRSFSWSVEQSGSQCRCVGSSESGIRFRGGASSGKARQSGKVVRIDRFEGKEMIVE